MKKRVIIFCCVLAAVFVGGAVGWALLCSAPTEEPVAYIYSDGVLVRTADLSQNAVFTVEHGGGSNTVQISGGAISVTEASCPDKVCVSTGAISHGAVPIICLPNRLEIIVKSADSAADAVVG